MLILTLRTDKPEAELGLFRNDTQLGYYKWHADRQLAETIHQRIKALLEANKIELSDIEAIAVYEGPGSFTGLRIGFSVANAFANSLDVPIIATTQENWIELAINRLIAGQNDRVAKPEYGALPNITQPKK